MTKEEIEKIKKIISELFSEMEIQAEIGVNYDEAAEVINIEIESPEAAVLIGFHGETLQSLQLIASFMVHKTLGKWVRVLVNVGDYRQKREDQLKKLALNLAMKVKFSGETQSIPNLNALERRMVHLVLADHPDVYTQSEGDGEQRQLFIKSKTSTK